MDRVRRPSAKLEGLTPYDPKYLPAEAMLSANENPRDVSEELRQKIEAAVREVAFNRYPDPLANDLRDAIAEANGLDREHVLVGNGGDELLFNTALAWGGPGRTFLNLPPTFSVYAANARLTDTDVLDIPRLADQDFAIDEEAVLRAASGPDSQVDFTIIASPNNPTGLRARMEFLQELLAATDALVMVDEAYFEFSRQTMRPHLEANKNLVILRTFSKAFSLAGVRVGYILGHPDVIREYLKVRQPYSVDAVSQAIARVTYQNRAEFEPGINAIIAERERLTGALGALPGVHAYPSHANWVLFRVPEAARVWQGLYDAGILVRDFSTAPGLEGTLRVTVGTPEEKDAFLNALRKEIRHG